MGASFPQLSDCTRAAVVQLHRQYTHSRAVGRSENPRQGTSNKVGIICSHPDRCKLISQNLVGHSPRLRQPCTVVVVRVVLAFQLFSWRQTKTTAKAAAWPMPPPDQGPSTLQTFDKFSSVANGSGADTAAAACQAPATL